MNSTAVTLTWLQPIDQDSGVLATGYEIFYKPDNVNSEIYYSGGETSVTHFILSDPVNSSNYSVFVVAYGGDLPSGHSNTVIIHYGLLSCIAQCTVNSPSPSLSSIPIPLYRAVYGSIGALLGIFIIAAVTTATVLILKKKKR